MEIFEGYSKQFLFFTSLFTRLNSTTRVSFIRSISRSRNFVSRREDARGAAAISTGSALSRARAHTLRHTATFTNGYAGEEETRRATRRRLVSINSVSLLTTRRG